MPLNLSRSLSPLGLLQQGDQLRNSLLVCLRRMSTTPGFTLPLLETLALQSPHKSQILTGVLNSVAVLRVLLRSGGPVCSIAGYSGPAKA